MCICGFCIYGIYGPCDATLFIYIYIFVCVCFPPWVLDMFQKKYNTSAGFACTKQTILTLKIFLPVKPWKKSTGPAPGARGQPTGSAGAETQGAGKLRAVCPQTLQIKSAIDVTLHVQAKLEF